MKTNRIKLLIIAVFSVSLIAVIGFKTNEVFTAHSSDTDVAAVYKTKCAACHSPKAEKFLDLSKTDEQFAEIILKGKKGEKPPFMPEFASKGITPEQAKALAAYMRKLRTPDSANTNANGANSNVKANTNANVTGNANANQNTAVNANTSVNAKANVNTTVNANADANTVVNANGNANTSANTKGNEALATIYKTKCAACHSPKAEKLYDPAIPVEEQVTAILKGKKAAKPPHMPAFEGKITAEQARALAEYMKSLRITGK
jgi:mono/diheme cytochrome c family protein